jgi:hypothetical protein
LGKPMQSGGGYSTWNRRKYRRASSRNNDEAHGVSIFSLYQHLPDFFSVSTRQNIQRARTERETPCATYLLCKTHCRISFFDHQRRSGTRNAQSARMNNLSLFWTL